MLSIQLSAELECYSCNSTKLPVDCLFIDDQSANSTCNSVLNRCYTIIVDDHIHRGCGGDERFPDLDSLQKCSDSAQCEICDNSYCNQKTVPDICIKCNSSDSSLDCAKDGNGRTNLSVACSLGDLKQSQGCYLRVISDTFTKGCMQHLDSTDQKLCREQSENCQSCTFPNCNRKVHFNTTCYECDEEIDATCLQKVKERTQISCKGYSKTCVAGTDVRGFMHRGCISYDKLNSTFPLGFKVCPDDLCNNQLYPFDRIICYQCEGKDDCEDLTHNQSKICSSQDDQCYAFLDNGMYNSP